MRLLKLLLVSVIGFGIYQYRTLLFGGMHYAASLREGLIYVSLIVMVSYLVNSWRVRYVLKRMGEFPQFQTALEYCLVTSASVFSLLKVGVGISVYYLKKRGSFLSNAISVLITERFFDSIVFAIAGALLLGEFSMASIGIVLVIVLSVYLGLKNLNRLPDNRWISKIKVFGGGLRELVNLKSGVTLFVIPLINIVLGALAISMLAKTSLLVGAKTWVLGMLVMVAAPTPFGLGVYEAAVPAYLISQGIASGVAVGAILTYRFLYLWIPAIIGILVLHKKL